MKRSTVQLITRTFVTGVAAAGAVFAPSVLANAYSDAALKGAGVALAGLLTDAGFKLAEQPLTERVAEAAASVESVAAEVKQTAHEATTAKKQEQVQEAKQTIANADVKTTAPGAKA